MKRDLLDILRIFKECDKSFENECSIRVPYETYFGSYAKRIIGCMVFRYYLGDNAHRPHEY